MEKCPDGKKRFPSHVSVIVLDNLNGSGVGFASEEAKKDKDLRPTLDKFLNDGEKQSAIHQLMALLDQFRSAVYCQTAPARHWGMPDVVDQIAEHVRGLARESKIATLDATQFWSSIKPFMYPAQLPPIDAKCSEGAIAVESGENVVNWHHYELGERKALPYH